MAIPQERITLEEFLAQPEQEPALEFFDGFVIQKMPPKGRHSVLQSEIAQRCNLVGVPGRLFRAFPELRVTFGGQSTVPDVAIYRWERIPRTARGRVVDDFVEPPDVAVEIASPGQSITALIRRCLWYVANGVRAALVIDPQDETVLLFRPNAVPIALRGSDLIDLSGVLPELRLTVNELFASLDVE